MDDAPWEDFGSGSAAVASEEEGPWNDFQPIDRTLKKQQLQREMTEARKVPFGQRLLNTAAWAGQVLDYPLHVAKDPLGETVKAGEGVTEAAASAIAGKPLVIQPEYKPSVALRQELFGKIPEVPKQQGAVRQVGAGIVNAGIGFLNFFQTPEGIATLGIGGLPEGAKRQALAVIGETMAANAPDAFNAAMEAASKGDWQEASKHTSNFLLSSGLGAKLLKEGKTPSGVATDTLRTIRMPEESKAETLGQAEKEIRATEPQAPVEERPERLLPAPAIITPEPVKAPQPPRTIGEIERFLKDLDEGKETVVKREANPEQPVVIGEFTIPFERSLQLPEKFMALDAERERLQNDFQEAQRQFGVAAKSKDVQGMLEAGNRMRQAAKGLDAFNATERTQLGAEFEGSYPPTAEQLGTFQSRTGFSKGRSPQTIVSGSGIGVVAPEALQAELTPSGEPLPPRPEAPEAPEPEFLAPRGPLAQAKRREASQRAQGIIAAQEAARISEAQKPSTGVPYKEPTVTTDLRQLEAQMKRGQIIRGTALEEWADKVLSEDPRSRTRGGLDPYEEARRLTAVAIKGAALIEQGIRDFTKWSKAMIKEHGEAIKPHLETLFRRSADYYDRQRRSSKASTPPKTVPFPSTPEIDQPITGLSGKVRDLWRAAALKAAPKMTDSNRQTGESAVRYAASFFVARTKGVLFAEKVLQDTGVDPVKFGTALAEDNLRGIKDANPDAEVTTLIGRERSPFKTEQEYQSFLADPKTQLAIARHKQLWSEQKEPLYRQANDIDPDVELSSRGRQTGARINLKALQEGEKGVSPIGRPSGFRQLATLKRRDPFGQRATGTSEAYEGDYREIMANGFEREMPVAKQHEFIRSLIDSGDAKVADREVMPDLTLKGEPTKGYVLRLNPWRGRFLHVRNGLQNEFEVISGLDPTRRYAIFTPFNNFFTRMAIQGFAEGTTHASNLMMKVFTGLGPTSNPILNALIKPFGRVDLLYSLPRVVIKAFSNQRERMLELAEMAAAKEPYKGFIARRILNPVDQGVRLVSDDIFKGMAENGWVEKGETNRREFINEVGNYNKRLQPWLIRKLRETGFQPFATAVQTFNVMGLRRLVGAPGVKATSNAAAWALRADIAAGWIGGIVLLATLNKIISGKATGPDGTPLGAIGWIGDDGKVHSFNLMRLLGYERGPRITGIGPYIEAKQRGLSNQQAVGAAVRSVTSAGLSMIAGPGPRALWLSTVGTRPTDPLVREAPAVPPTDSMSPLKTQLAKNIETALIESTPIASSVSEGYKSVKEGKGLGEVTQAVLEKQASRYTPRTGISEETAKALPKIADTRQLHDYVDGVAKEARKLPLRDREAYVKKRFEDDELEKRFISTAWQYVDRKGVLKYK